MKSEMCVDDIYVNETHTHTKQAMASFFFIINENVNRVKKKIKV